MRTVGLWWSFLGFVVTLSVSAVAIAEQTRGGPGSPGAAAGTVDIIVKLEDEAVASYGGTIVGLPATSPHVTGAARVNQASSAVQAYQAHLAQKHTAFEAAAVAAIPSARVTYRYHMVLNGIAMRVPADQLGRVARLPGVKAVYRDQLLQLHTDTSPKFIGAKTLWGKLGGQDDAGEGVVVGILDTGIWPEHPSFSDPDPKGKPYPAPPTAPAQCDLDAYTCHFKLIGAYRFMVTYDACAARANNPCTVLPGDFLSARDSEGHGTHTASTAAGNGLVEAELFGVDHKKVSGIAPRAHLVAYKVCGRDGCFASDSVAAIQRAIIDNVDVINFSVSGGSNPYDDFVELAFRDAYAAGVFVAASAGNSGPAADSVEHRGPWVTTVAASTENRSFLSTVTFVASNGDKLRLTGASITPGIVGATPIVVAANFGDEPCQNSSPDGAFTGKIVVCKRGTNARIVKSFNVQQRGAIGMILYNDRDPQELETDNHSVPSVHVTNADGLALLSFLSSHMGATAATFPGGKAKATQGDVMAQFSSRGGTRPVLGVSKPDITAPGVQILAGMTPQPAEPADGPPGELFQAIAGTSMSSPHIAGAAALLKQLRPTWTPGQIKSALMTTASTKKLFQEDGVTPFTPFDAGSGRVDLSRAASPGLTFDVPVSDYINHTGDLYNVNYPSVYIPDTAPPQVTVQRTARSMLLQNSVWELSVIDQPIDLHIIVPPTISVPAGGSATFAIGIDKAGLPTNQSRHATLQLKHGATLLHMPIVAAGPVSRQDPDLIVTALSSATTATRGSPMNFSGTIKNVGAASATNFAMQFYLSRTDATPSPDDVPFAFCTLGSLVVNASFTCDSALIGPVAVPPSIPPGTYYFILRADEDRTVFEKDENNNVSTFGPITIN
jgi:subtilisin family serine protease